MKHVSLARMMGCFAACVFGVTPVIAKELDPYATVQKVLDQHVVPEVMAFSDVAAELPRIVTHVCTEGGDAAREELEGHIRKALIAYARIDFLRFGPLQQDGMREKLSFWPDPRGILQRQLRQFLTSPDASAATPDLMRKQSAALQGLPALEALIFDAQAAPLGPDAGVKTRCIVSQAIAGAFAANAADLKNRWIAEGGWKDKMLRPGSDNDTYKEPSEAASELVKALLVGLQLISDVQVKPHVAVTGREQPNQPYGPYLLSGSSKDFFASSTASLHQFYQILDLESGLGDDQGWIVNWAGAAWRAILVSDGQGGVAGGASRQAGPPPREVFDKIVGLRKLVSREMATASKLTVGFNELDGD